jgi:hypothetical protein
MTLSRTSLLHAWSSRYGVLPIYGGRPTHARNSAALVPDVRGEFYSAIINTPRFSWGTDKSTTERRAGLLLEPARTNSLRWSRDLTNAAWSGGAATGSAVLNAQGLDGATNGATTLTDTDASAHFYRYQDTTIANDSATHVARWWVLKDANTSRFPGFEVLFLGGTTKDQVTFLNTATGALTGGASVGGGAVARVYDDGLWWVVELAITNNTSGNTTVRAVAYPALGTVAGTAAVATTGSTVLGNVQLELNASVGSSPILTTTAAASRATDGFWWQYAAAPQGLMAFHRSIERGDSAFGGSAPCWMIGDDVTADPRVQVYGDGAGNYLAYYLNGGVSRSVTLASGAVAGDTVDTVFVLTPSGQVMLILSVNGAAVSSTALSAATTLPTAWANAKLWLNQSLAGFVGIAAHLDLRLVKYADVVASTAQGIMDEVRGMELSPSGDFL